MTTLFSAKAYGASLLRSKMANSRLQEFADDYIEDVNKGQTEYVPGKQFDDELLGVTECALFVRGKGNAHIGTAILALEELKREETERDLSDLEQDPEFKGPTSRPVRSEKKKGHKK